LLQQLPSGALYFGAWLNQNGISYFLQRHYRNSQWLTAIDKGVMYRTGDKATLFSALSCFNSQLNKKFHIGALSAFEVTVSSPERAFLESSDLAPKYYNLTDLYQVMEMLNGLRPNLLQ
jgi:hypothetical protein